ncbi:hypothetical protein NC652_032850 [Populus alba x Populus x berolinensis]|nr:hypothetical protein NC652_032850 [Populus alba x Populus x berolinensis]
MHMAWSISMHPNLNPQMFECDNKKPDINCRSLWDLGFEWVKLYLP